MSKIVIFGAGDIAKLAHYYFTNDSEHEVAAFTVDKKYRKNNFFSDLPLINFEEIVEYYSPEHYKMFIALSYTKMNNIRASKFYEAKELGYKLISYVSSKCSFLTNIPVGENCFILEDNTIQPFVKIGNNVILWSGNHIGHDSTIEDHCFISSHVVVSGNCYINQKCFVGVNATISNSVTLAPETLIGAGAVIMENTIEKGVYVPQKAIMLQKKSDEIEL